MYRLGLDIGTNSIGWSLFDLNHIVDDFPEFIDGGVRLFSDGRNPKDKEPLNVTRRTAKGIRRTKERRNNRYLNLINFFKKHGFINSDNEKKIFDLNPYKARAEALDNTDNMIYLVRGILNIGKRRGYKSNRKEASDKDGGKIKDGIDKLKLLLGNRTLGQFLYNKHEKNPFEKIRFSADVETKFYPTREMYESEFNTLKSTYYSVLSTEKWEIVHKIIFHQRPLKAQPKGKCQFEILEERIYKADPLFQKFRMFQEVNSLSFISNSNYKGSEGLSELQKSLIFEKLHTTQEPAFSTLKKIKDKNKQAIFADDIKFNLEEQGRTKLQGLATDICFSDEKCFGKKWFALSDDERSQIVKDCLDTETNHELQQKFMAHYGLSKDQAENCVKINLEKGIGSVSVKFIKKVLPYLKQGLKYHDACKQAGYHHSDFNTGEVFEFLPYYGQMLVGSTVKPKITPTTNPDEAKYGKVTNVTVHVALNQIRKLVNEIIKEYGAFKITEIIIEVTRYLKKSQKEVNKINNEQKKNRDANDKMNDILKSLGVANPNYDDRMKYKLWLELGNDELSRKCIFSGKNIAQSDLFNGTVDIEHIFPLSRTLDDSFGNKTLAYREANHLKGNCSPFESFGSDKHAGYKWQDILDRSRILPAFKRWRFEEGAIQKYLKDDPDGFIARQLTDTAYISKATRQYLTAICNPYKIWATPGKLTAMLRHHWGLNHFISDDGSKDRSDNRHHLIDAFVIGLTERGLIKKISTMTARNVDIGRDRLKIYPLPENLKEKFKACFDSVIISNRPDRDNGGCLFADTAYGILPQTDPAFKSMGKDDYTLVTRKAITALSVKELSAIRDTHHRNNILNLCSDLFDVKGKISDKDKKELEKRLIQYGNDNKLKKLRILVSKGNARPIKSAPYKAYMLDSFAFCDIYEVDIMKNNQPTGKKDYIGHFVPNVDAIKIKGTKQEIGEANDSLTKEFKLTLNRDKYKATTAKKLMRLYKNDTVSMIENGKEAFFKVYGFSSTNNKLDIRPVTINSEQAFKTIPALIEKQLKPIKLSVIGRVLGHGTHTHRRAG
jgi:CRISPR-associated endonuclease Csn1